jgi:hypothetical protein
LETGCQRVAQGQVPKVEIEKALRLLELDTLLGQAGLSKSHGQNRMQVLSVDNSIQLVAALLVLLVEHKASVGLRLRN